MSENSSVDILWSWSPVAHNIRVVFVSHKMQPSVFLTLPRQLTFWLSLVILLPFSVQFSSEPCDELLDFLKWKMKQLYTKHFSNRNRSKRSWKDGYSWNVSGQIHHSIRRFRLSCMIFKYFVCLQVFCYQKTFSCIYFLFLKYMYTFFKGKNDIHFGLLLSIIYNKRITLDLVYGWWRQILFVLLGDQHFSSAEFPDRSLYILTKEFQIPSPWAGPL